MLGAKKDVKAVVHMQDDMLHDVHADQFDYLDLCRFNGYIVKRCKKQLVLLAISLCAAQGMENSKLQLGSTGSSPIGWISHDVECFSYSINGFH